MTIDVVSCDEMFFMLLLRSSYAIESPSLYDDGGFCVSSWRRGVRTTRYELCFWKPVVGEKRAYFGYVITCCFQTRYGFCFFQLRGECEKAEPGTGSFHRSFNPHVAHFIRQRGAIKGTTRTELRRHTIRLWCCITRIMLTIFRLFISHVGE